VFALRSQFAFVALTALSAMSGSVYAVQLQDEPDAANLSSPAPPSLTPEQMPSGPVVITYGNGELTIQALNSELGDVLRTVSRETGALIEVPGEAKERVFGEFGPGPIANVLASLLNGSHFNYVMMGRADNPRALARVILTSKPADIAPGKNQAQAHSKRANVAVAEANSAQTQRSQPVPARAQAVPAPSSVVPPDAQNTDADFVDALATELGSEATTIDPEATLAQTKPRGGQDPGAVVADSNASPSIPRRIKTRHKRW